MNLIYLLLTSYGLTYLAMYAKIFNISREYIVSKFLFIQKLLKCGFCVSWWTGLLLSIIFYICGDLSIKYALIFPFISMVFGGFLNYLFIILSEIVFLIEELPEK